MAIVRPFKAVRPQDILTKDVAALPYDVYSREEAAEAVKGRPLSFLNIDRPETMFDADHDMYADDVYEAARKKYLLEKKEGVFVSDAKPCFYIYELTMNGRRQTGVVGLSSVDDYLSGVCKKHENTVEAKEQDRIRHIDALSAQTGPIFLAYHADKDINALIEAWKKNHLAIADFTSEDSIGHAIWVINSDDAIGRLEAFFGRLSCTYIADGHHRAASAVRVGLKRRNEALARGENDPDAEYNYFLSVLFPDEQLEILDYNRVVKDLNGYTEDEFIKALGESFEVKPTSLSSSAVSGKLNAAGEVSGTADCLAQAEGLGTTAGKPDGINSNAGKPGGLKLNAGNDIFRAGAEDVLKPQRKYDIGMYLNGRSYMLRLKPAIAAELESDPVARLDVSVLQDRVLSKLLNIKNPRTDQRIEFVGGIRGMDELVKNADEYTAISEKEGRLKDVGPAVAFAMYPTSIAELFAVADAGLMMPPKSTWFEPKLRSGLFIHEF